MTINDNTIIFGHSPDADDAFMFFAMEKKYIEIPGYSVAHHMEDIESLNILAATGKLPVTAISAARYPDVAEHYRIMSCGSSIGRNYGPMVVSVDPMTEADLEGKRIAVPGQFTTSWLLFQIFGPSNCEPLFLDFDDIGPAVEEGRADVGILLHEGQILYEKLGFHGIMSLGEKWHGATGLPIPLGVDLVSRHIGNELAQTIADASLASINYARANEDIALEYALGFGRGINPADGKKFVRMYVNEDTVDMGEEGRHALEKLFSMAVERGVLGELPKLDILQAK
ncbi:MAG: ABC transporter substrate-binding protein [Dehalococcoidia bacterium]|jgi:1,4-dihydroxy-6-naphthoate synthase|nr:ABC transporter substrate-binding protein [Chloroflexota bacterium]MDP6056137.1 ABC transporter substrate-binding protein [Dehalococcoidia bacterium]MDP7090604.1 ABC transporter substrate-binding protein [Dehalococcoidia bacterium]MDP7262019.1 ABC transporter substrate-binding protein [Dehalococcoidia bacterium]MDP7485008.1 ABC transporter substrate-binding protein [Dehalococcoidia bacterium]|tara:strand:+ start:6529 stop:7380 length:852 start_codon:yes stop_codon:yes gene_type:complete